MKNIMKKTIAFLLTLVMLVNIFPLAALAEDNSDDLGKRGPLNLKKGGDRSVSQHTVIVYFGEGVSWDSNQEHYYVQLKQNNVPKDKIDYNNFAPGFTQTNLFSVQEVSPEGANEQGIKTYPYSEFYGANIGGENNWGTFSCAYVSSEDVEASIVVSSNGGTLSSQGVAQNPGTSTEATDVHGYNYTISTDNQTDRTVIKIGTILCTGSITGLPDGECLPAEDYHLFVEATIDGAQYYAPLTQNGDLVFSVPGRNDGKLPGEPSAFRVVKESNNGYSAVTSDIKIGNEYYAINGPTQSGTSFTFTAVKRFDCNYIIDKSTATFDTAQKYFIVAKRNGTAYAYAKVSDTDSPQFNNVIYNDSTFAFVKTTSQSIDLDNYSDSNYDESNIVTSEHGSIDNILFTWNYNVNTNTYEFIVKDMVSDIFVDIQYASGTTDLGLTDGEYYLVAGWNNGPTSYAFTHLDRSLAGTYGFDTADLPTTPHDTMFIVLKRYDDPADPRVLDGTALISNQPVVVGDNPNTVSIGENDYVFSISGPENDNGKQRYTITVEKVANKFYMKYPQGTDSVSFTGKYYYLLARRGNTPAYFAPLPATTTTDPITFYGSDTSVSTTTLPNVTIEIKESNSEITNLAVLAGKNTVTQFVTNDSDRYEVSTETHNGTAREYDIVATEVTTANSVVFDFKDNGVDDENASLTGKYYLGITINGTKYFAKICPSGSKAVLQNFRKLEDPNDNNTYQIPDTLDNIQYEFILNYTGEGELTAEYIMSGSQPRYNYDPDGKLSKVEDGKPLELYNIVKNSQRDSTDRAFHITANKRQGYQAFLNFVDQTQSNPVVPGEGEAPAITEYSYAVAQLCEGETADVVGFAVERISTNASSNVVVFDSFKLLNGGTISYADRENYYVNAVWIGHSSTASTPPDNYSAAENLDYSDFDGYTFVSNHRNNWTSESDKGDPRTATSSTIIMRRSDPTEYRVKLDCGESPLTLPEGYSIYAKVTIQHTSNKGYGFVKLDTSTDGGLTYLGTVNTWYKSDGVQIDHKETLTGHESEVKVELYAVPSGTSITKPADLSGKAIPIGGAVKTHEVVSYPDICKDTSNPNNNSTTHRIVDEEPNVKTTITDIIYLDKNDDTFSLYSLERLLNGGYNIITLCESTTIDQGFGENVNQGDAYIGCHQMGSILVRGDVDLAGKTTGVADSDKAINPSVVGGKMGTPSNAPNPFIHNRPSEYITMVENHPGIIVDAYLGSANTVAGNYVNGTLYSVEMGGKTYGFNRAGSTVINDNYVDWDRLQKAVRDASSALLSQASPVHVTPNDSGVVDVAPGANVIVDMGEHTSVTINITGTDEQLFVNGKINPDLAGTVINFTGNAETMNVPALKLNGQTLNTDETGNGISIVYNFPDCTGTVQWTSGSEFGHVLAPKAFVKFTGGNYSGTLIGNNVYVGPDSEGHLYPYHGGNLVGIYAKIDFGKKLDSSNPTTQKFKFDLDKFTDSATTANYTTLGNEAFWINDQEVKNEGGAISFDDIPFFSAGTYYFRIYEDTSVSRPGIIYDETKYLMKVVVTAATEGYKTILSIDTNESKLYEIIDEAALIAVTDDTEHDAKIAHINIDDNTVVTEVTGITFAQSTTSSENKKVTIATGKNFVNTTDNVDVSVTFTGTKQVEGQPLTGTVFNFNVTLHGTTTVVATGSSSGAGGTITFTRIGYRAADVFSGANADADSVDYYYTVTEVMHPDANASNNYTVNGIKYDNSEKTIKVTVTKTATVDGYSYTAEVTEGLADLEFTNAYITDATQHLEIGKSVTGYTGDVPNIFEFTVAAQDPTTAPLPSQVTATNAGSTVTFGTMTYNTPGDYYYTITETNYAEGATDEQKDKFNLNTSTVIFAKVHVSGPNAQNQLIAGEPVYYSDAAHEHVLNNPEITNILFVGNLSVTKNTEGVPSSASSKTFKIRVKQGTTVYAQDGSVASGDGWVTFTSGQTVTWSDLPVGTYTVEEDKDDAAIPDYSLVVTGDGDVQVNKTHTATAPATATVKNAYTQEVSSVKVTKAFTGLTATELPANFKITNDFDTSLEFTYTNADNAATADGITTPFEWTIQNVPLNTTVTFKESGILVDGYELEVNGKATTTDTAIVVAISTENDVATAKLVNDYTKKTGTAVPEIIKKMEGPDAGKAPDMTYMFKLHPVNGAPMPASDTVYVSLKKGELQGSSTFGEITYDTAGTYQYEITEVPGDMLGMTYSQDKVKVTVEVTEGTTKLDTAVTYENDNKILINTYKQPDTPTFEKKIMDTNDTTGDTSDWQDSADYDIGDSVPYKLTAILAKDVTDYWQYHVTFHDTLEKGLTFEKIEKVEVNGQALPENGYTFTKISDQQFDLTVMFNDGLSEITDTSLNGGKVEVFFTAILNENAELGQKGNVNTANMEYSCNPSLDQDGKPSTDTETTPDDFVICFTYQVDINKVDPNGKALSGAEFKLEKKLKDGTKKEIACVKVQSKDAFNFSGLDDGEYILTETKAPDGYNAIEPVTFTVTAEHQIIWTNLSERNNVLTSLTGDVPTGELTFTADKGTGSLTADVTNGKDLTSATVKKVWDDDGNRDGLRPLALMVELLADGEKTGKTVRLAVDNNWVGQIDNIPKYNADGTEIVYTWAEASVIGYELTDTAESGTLTILTNTHTPDTVPISVRKVWVDDGTHPNEVEVQLFAGGQAVGDVVTLNEANGWKYSWGDLCKNVTENGQVREIRYTVAELEIPEGYTAKITGGVSTGFVITNTLEEGKLIIEKQFDIQTPDEIPEEDEMKTEIEVVKYWDDQDNKDGNRPEFITVHLFAGGEEVKTATLTAQNGWRKKWGDLPKFVDGHPIHYSVTEDPVKWYVPEIHGFTITNHYNPETTSVIVRKVWHDEGHEDMRPVSIAVKLSNGMGVILNEANGWTGVIDGLPTYVNGEPAVYTWSEPEVLGYTQESVVTKGNTTEITNKIWQREENPQNGKKPKLPGTDLTLIDEYDTPLGVEVIINHVGDCFD